MPAGLFSEPGQLGGFQDVSRGPWVRAHLLGPNPLMWARFYPRPQTGWFPAETNHLGKSGFFRKNEIDKVKSREVRRSTCCVRVIGRLYQSFQCAATCYRAALMV